MNQNVQKLVLTRFAALYGAPVTDEPEAFIAEYHRALKGYVMEALMHGTDKVIASNTFRAWPTVGECVAACNSYRPPRSLQNAAIPVEAFGPPPTPEQEAARAVHVARTMEMIAELKAKTLTNATVSQRLTNRDAFANRPGWSVPDRVASLKGKGGAA